MDFQKDTILVAQRNAFQHVRLEIQQVASRQVRIKYADLEAGIGVFLGKGGKRTEIHFYLAVEETVTGLEV